MSPNPDVSARNSTPPSAEVSAYAAHDAYTDRSQSDVDKRTEVKFGDQTYRVFGYKDDPATGFHATAYQNTATNDVIIAYRGTDPDQSHAVTRVQDIAVDATMVRDKINPQIPVADAFTQDMINKAAALGIDKNRITAAGHSLGGTETQIEGAKFGLHAATFNAYGAADFGYKAPADPNQITNYVMAGDVVSAGNHHLGNVVTLASPEDVQGLKSGRYLDASAGAQPANPFLAMQLGDHDVTHFAPDPNSGQTSVLDPKLMAQYEKNYTDNKGAFDAYRGDVYHERGELSEALRQAQGSNAQAHLPSDIQRQANEFLAVSVDPAIQKGAEQNSAVQGVEHGLQQGADAMSAAGRYVQSQDERVATAARKAGDVMAPVDPFAPLAGAAVAEAAHLQGKAALAAGDFAANELQSAKQAVERGAHDVAQTTETAIRSPEAQSGIVKGANTFINAYQGTETAGRSIEQAYDHTKEGAVHDVHAAEQTAQAAKASTISAGQHVGHEANQVYDATKQAAAHGVQDAQRAASDVMQSIHTAGTAVSKEASQAQDALGQAASQLQNKLATSLRLDHPDHPDHQMFKQAQDGVQKIDAKLGRTPDQHSENLAGALTAAAKKEGITKIDAVHMSSDGSVAFAAQNTTPLKTVASVNTMQALNTPMEQSTQKLAEVDRATPQNAQAQVQQPAQNQNQQSSGVSR